MSTTPEFVYVGSELDVFALATNWKRYWSAKIEPYLGPTILDVGAGKGATARLLAGGNRQWFALEPDADLARCIEADIAAGNIARNCQVKVGTLADLEPQQKFDTILYMDVLEHIEHDRDELARASKHLKPGGHIVMLAPAHNWLFTPFDKAVGHFRRYDRRLVDRATPENLVLKRAFFLDSVGMLASLANVLILKSAEPSAGQIKLWDKAMVPVSRALDPLTGYRLGKSVIAIWQHAGTAAST